MKVKHELRQGKGEKSRRNNIKVQQKKKTESRKRTHAHTLALERVGTEFVKKQTAY